MAPLGYPFGEELRQNLLLDVCTGVEPVSADVQSDKTEDDHGRPWRKFHPDDAVGENRGSVPSLVIISPAMVLVRRMLCEGRSSLFR